MAPRTGSAKRKRKGKAAPTPKEAQEPYCTARKVQEAPAVQMTQRTADVGFIGVPNVSKARIRQRPRLSRII